MKVVIRILLFVIGMILLVELNSGTFVSGIKGLFNKKTTEIIDSSDIVKTIPVDYLRLLNLKENCCNVEGSPFFFLKTFQSKYRNPISFFIYKKQYYLQVYKMDGAFNSSIKNILTTLYINAKMSYGGFLLDDESEIEYSYKLSAPPKPKTIFLKILGKNNQIILKNDSIAYYFSSVKNFSIQYQPTGVFDIYGETKGNGLFSYQLQPQEILFIKRNKALFLLMMSVLSNHTPEQYAPGMLYNLVEKNTK